LFLCVFKAIFIHRIYIEIKNKLVKIIFSVYYG